MTSVARIHLALLLLVASAGACGPPRPPFPVPPQYRQTVDGPVVGVDRRSLDEQLAQGLRVTLQPTGRPLVVVDLAPGWYLDQHGLRFSERDRLTVEGTIAPDDGVLRAQRVSKGTVSVRLRDELGHPYWDPAAVPQAK